MTVNVKWAGVNTPIIKVGNKSLIISKRELLAIRDSINEFVAYYNDNFEESKSDYSDSQWIEVGEHTSWSEP